MSVTGEKVLNLSEFNANLVLGYFDVLPHDESARCAIEFKFKLLRGETPLTDPDFQGKLNEISQITIESIELRYFTYNDNIEDFFPKGIPADHEAMVLAVICDHDIHSANEPVQASDEEEESELRVRNDGFKPDQLKRAQDYFDEALNLQKGLPPEDGISTMEGSYIFHLNALQALHEKEELISGIENNEISIFDLEPEQLDEQYEFLNKEIPNMLASLRQNTDLGAFLKDAIEDVARRLQAILPPPPPVSKPRGAHLHLVRS